MSLYFFLFLIYNVAMENEKLQQQREKAASICEWVDAFCSAVIVCVLIFTFAVKSAVVDGTSMDPTYESGQRVIGIVPYCNLDTGDVVITDTNNGIGKSLFKRVVATEYQYVSIDPQTGAIYVDGVLFDSPIPTTVDNLKGDIEYPFYVPRGCVFLMGDNRRVSNDCRYTAVGFIDARSITGKAVG